MSRERQTKLAPSLWPKNGPLGRFFPTCGLAWVMRGLWRRALINFLASLATSRNTDRAFAPALTVHNTSPFWRSGSHKKIPAGDFPAQIHRIAGRLPIVRRPQRRARRSRLSLSLPSPINQSLFSIALPRGLSWPYKAIRGPGPEKFPLAKTCLVVTGEGAG